MSRKEDGRRSRQSAAGDPTFWQELAPTLQPAVGPIAFGFISKQMVSGAYAEGVLTLYVSQEAIKKWLSSEERRQGLERAASAKAGRPVHVMIEVGTPKSVPLHGQGTAAHPAPAGGSAALENKAVPVPEDPLKELLSFAQTAGKGIVTID